MARTARSQPAAADQGTEPGDGNAYEASASAGPVAGACEAAGADVAVDPALDPVADPVADPAAHPALVAVVDPVVADAAVGDAAAAQLGQGNALRVISRSGRVFRRAGWAFDATPRIVPLDQLTAEQAAAIRAEPALVVDDVLEIELSNSAT
jgi:hypothetical protein